MAYRMRPEIKALTFCLSTIWIIYIEVSHKNTRLKLRSPPEPLPGTSTEPREAGKERRRERKIRAICVDYHFHLAKLFGKLWFLDWLCNIFKKKAFQFARSLGDASSPSRMAWRPTTRRSWSINVDRLQYALVQSSALNPIKKKLVAQHPVASQRQPGVAWTRSLVK